VVTGTAKRRQITDQFASEPLVCPVMDFQWRLSRTRLEAGPTAITGGIELSQTGEARSPFRTSDVFEISHFLNSYVVEL
jgi:hypothetical protein